MTPGSTSETPGREEDPPKLKKPEERAAEVFEDEGGLPDENPFSDVVDDLRDEGYSWNEIWDLMDAVYDVVDSVAFEESLEMSYEWDVVVDPMPHDEMVNTKTHSELADTETEARSQVDTTGEAEIVSVERTGVAKYS